MGEGKEGRGEYKELRHLLRPTVTTGLAPWLWYTSGLDGPPSVDTTSSSRHRSIAGYQPTIVLIAAGRRSVHTHSMRRSQILGQIPDFCLPHVHSTFCTEKLEWCGYSRRWKKFEDVFIRFDRMYERDRQTDRHSMTRPWPMAALA